MGQFQWPENQEEQQKAQPRIDYPGCNIHAGSL
jgi:hypothetical protein